MRLAVVADIHGNLPALQAVIADIADIKQREVDGVVNLGDCVSGPLWPGETCELLMKLDWPTVRGNHDRWVTDWPPEKHYPGDAHAFSELIPQHLDWLRRHPSTLDLGKGVFACHGQPIDDNAYLLESIENGRLVLARSEEVERRLGAVTANIILCGHSHIARTIVVNQTTFINPGSVGQPAYEDPSPPAHVSETGSPAARYAVVELTSDSTDIEFRSVPYDHATAVQRALDRGSPTWAHFLRTGYARPA